MTSAVTAMNPASPAALAANPQRRPSAHGFAKVKAKGHEGMIMPLAQTGLGAGWEIP